MTGREFSCYPDVFVTLLNGVSCQTSFVNNWAFFVSYFKKTVPPPSSTFEFGGQSGDNYKIPKQHITDC